MSQGLIGLVDAGFIARAGGRWVGGSTAKYDGDSLVGWLKTVAKRLDRDFLRVYWYDGAYSPNDANYHKQRERFDELESCQGLQLRLGHLERRPFDYKLALRKAAEEIGISYQKLMEHFHPEAIYQQKGVDTLLVLDMIQLAQQKACSTIVLMAGDRDLVEAVRVVQRLGCTLVIAYPDGAPVSQELRNLADSSVAWTESMVQYLTKSYSERLAAQFPDLMARIESEIALPQ